MNKLNGFNNGRDTTDGIGGVNDKDFKRMTYQEIKDNDGLWAAVNQSIIDCLNGEITGGDLLDVIQELHPEMP